MPMEHLLRVLMLHPMVYSHRDLDLFYAQTVNFHLHSVPEQVQPIRLSILLPRRLPSAGTQQRRPLWYVIWRGISVQESVLFLPSTNCTLPQATIRVFHWFQLLPINAPISSSATKQPISTGILPPTIISVAVMGIYLKY